MKGSESGHRSVGLCGAVIAVLAVSILGAQPAVAQTQSAAAIVGRMFDEYRNRAESIENYTLVQQVMGLETLSYFEKELVDGRPVFRLRRSSANGMEIENPTEGGVDEIYMMGAELARRASYLGSERINDYDVHVLDIPDLSGTGFGRNVTQDSEFTPTRGRLYLDIDTYAPRRMTFEGVMRNAGGVSTLTSTIDMADYREIDGLLLPHLTVINIDGLGAAIDPATRAQFEEMQRELEMMPPEQRAMVEAAMAGQLEQFRAMMGEEGAPMIVEVMVREVFVNIGPPR